MCRRRRFLYADKKDERRKTLFFMIERVSAEIDALEITL
jgi:hypothetical protein